MKTLKLAVLASALFISAQSMAQSTSDGKVGKTINKIGNKTAQVAVK